jgi:hypothetical protein
MLTYAYATVVKDVLHDTSEAIGAREYCCLEFGLPQVADVILVITAKRSCLYLGSGNRINCSQRQHAVEERQTNLKGTVSQDFRPSVFSSIDYP